MDGWLDDGSADEWMDEEMDELMFSRSHALRKAVFLAGCDTTRKNPLACCVTTSPSTPPPCSRISSPCRISPWRLPQIDHSPTISCPWRGQ